MTTREYKHYIKSNKWKELRKKAKERSNYKCEFCGKSAECVHHIKYSKNLEDDDLQNLVVCCKKCHKLSHGIREQEKFTSHILDKFVKNNLQNSDDEHFICTDCGGEFKEEPFFIGSDNQYILCYKCAGYYKCDICGNIFCEASIDMFDGKCICSTCENLNGDDKDGKYN